MVWDYDCIIKQWTTIQWIVWLLCDIEKTDTLNTCISSSFTDTVRSRFIRPIGISHYTSMNVKRPVWICQSTISRAADSPHTESERGRWHTALLLVILSNDEKTYNSDCEGSLIQERPVGSVYAHMACKHTHTHTYVLYAETPKIKFKNWHECAKLNS